MAQQLLFAQSGDIEPMTLNFSDVLNNTMVMCEALTRNVMLLYHSL